MPCMAREDGRITSFASCVRSVEAAWRSTMYTYGTGRMQHDVGRGPAVQLPVRYDAGRRMNGGQNKSHQTDSNVQRPKTEDGRA